MRVWERKKTRVRQRIIVALLILAMGTMNVGTLSVYAAETENQNVIKEEFEITAWNDDYCG